MSSSDATEWITTTAQLQDLFGPVATPSVTKEVSYIHPLYREMIEASPFAVLATGHAGGMDISPRGDAPGFVVVEDAHTLLLPERRGNNRVDSLHNILANPDVALLFLIPGIGETLRVNGKARISIAPELLQRFVVDGKPPKCVLQIAVDTVFFQCSRAIVRSHLWQLTPPQNRTVPTAGKILSALSDASINGEEYDNALPARIQATLY